MARHIASKNSVKKRKVALKTEDIIDVPAVGVQEILHNTPESLEETEYDLETARAKKETWNAKLVELEFKIRMEQYVLRTAVKQTCATAFSSIAQTLRSIPDSLERREGVDPKICDRISVAIDDALNNLHEEFSILGG